MPDITMCTGEECPRKEKCYRYTAPPAGRRQAYFVNPPLTWNSSDGGCDHFYDNGASDIMKKQSGFTVVELIISIVMAAIVISIAVTAIGGCGVDQEAAQEAAEQYKHNISGATGVSCVATDSDKDGYCSCTVFRGDKDPIGIECGCERFCLSCARGCKMAVPKFRERE